MSRAKTYNGKRMPASAARPLGTSRPTRRKADKKKIANVEKEVDSAPQEEVGSIQLAPDAIPQPAVKEQKMTITLKSLSKNGKQAYYSGAAQVLRFPLGVFPNKVAPASFEVTDDLFAAPAVKAKLTAEERKAARAAKPKPTLAELAAKAQERANKLAAKAAAAAEM